MVILILYLNMRLNFGEQHWGQKQFLVFKEDHYVQRNFYLLEPRVKLFFKVLIFLTVPNLYILKYFLIIKSNLYIYPVFKFITINYNNRFKNNIQEPIHCLKLTVKVFQQTTNNISKLNTAKIFWKHCYRIHIVKYT